MATTHQEAHQPQYSHEQSQYINHDCIDDTKLLATAGSGKTFCIIHHIIHLVKEKLVTPDEVYMLTFSKNAKDDFRTKIRKQNATDYILPKNICTIDSFAYMMLGQAIASTIDVSLLSYAWMDELENTPIDILIQKYQRLGHIKMVFVDEAQDLNDIQYRILMRMRDVCKSRDGSSMTIHMVGDPNQNIYQFRQASDKYLMNFPATTFHLTRNYRSQAHIVEFSSHLRPYNNVTITAENPKHSKLDVTFYAYDNSATFEHMLVSTLHMFKASKIPLHKVAILAPTRGYIRNPLGMCKYKGLCYIANMLYHHNIPFKQFYSDTNANDPDAFEAAKVKYKPLSGHLNLMTYTSSKGLEWDYVIIIDANAHLITRNNYDNAKYLAEKYLLYVACSRPRKNLLVFTKSRYANPWFKDVPSDTYKISPRCRDAFDFFDSNKLFDKQQPNVTDEEKQAVLLSPSAIINTLDLEELYAFEKRLRGRYMASPMNGNIEVQTPPSPFNVPESRAPFMRAFLTHLYYVVATGEPLGNNHYLTVDVCNVINNDNILVCTNERIMSWYFENRSSMTWEAYECTKPSIEPRIVQYIEARFDKEKPFSSYTLVDKFYELYITSSLGDIKKIYNDYLVSKGTNPMNIMHMTRIAYAIRTTHYFYIKQGQEFEDSLFKENEMAIKELVTLAQRHFEGGFLSEVKKYVRDEDRSLFFYYDKTHDNRNLNIRTKNTLSIKDILSAIMTQHIENPDLPFTEFYCLQLSTPKLFKYTVTITPPERTQIFNDLMAVAESKLGCKKKD